MITRQSVVVPLLGAATGLLVGLALLPLLPQPLYRDEMHAGAYRAEGLFDPPGNLQGFYDLERLPDGTTYRWSEARATIIFPYAAHAGRHAHIRLRLAANWAPGQRPVEVSLLVNGRPAANLIADREFRVVEAVIDTQRTPNPYLESSHVQIDLISSETRVQGDPRRFGVALDWVELQPERSRRETLLIATLWALGLAAVLALALTRMTLLWAALYGTGALITFVALQLTYQPRAIAPIVEAGLAALVWALSARLASRAIPVWGLGLAACLLWLLIAGRVLGDWQMDDAYISYRYAWNLVNGYGLVYNVGEPVEGYTNFLWTILAAGAIRLGLSPAGFALTANIALSFGLLSVSYHLARRMARERVTWALLVAALLSVDVGLITYGARGSGMEATLFAFLSLLAAALLWAGKRVGDPLWRVMGGVALTMSALTRPEGLMVAAILLAVRAAQDYRTGLRALPLLGAALLPMLAILVPYHAWRLSFYGYPFPNTFYAKTGFSPALLERGYEYLYWFWMEHWLVSSLVVSGSLITLLGWLGGWRRTVRGPSPPAASNQYDGLRVALGALILAQVAYVLQVGGDYFPGWRFFTVILAPMVLLAVEGLRLGFRHLPARPAVGASALALLLLVSLVYVRDSLWLQEPRGWLMELTKLHSTYVDRWGSAGLWLRENTPPHTLTAVKGAGAIAYYGRRPVLDAYGLNDLHIAHLEVPQMGTRRAGHEKEDPAYVLDRRPDFILELETYMAPVKQRMKEEYEYVVYRAPTGRDIGWWQRKSTARP